ncbi:MAG: 2'-5' RNA ligase family protein [Nanoarchaeota archaeon]|nr:2'-5' RNA ligase family protein [Nanoarchaeota archaeon]
MATRAIDIALLPPDDVMDRAIAANTSLGEGRMITLNKETCLPHITLVMGCLADENLPVIKTLLQETAARFLPVALSVTSVSCGPAGNVAFQIEKTEPLLELQRTLMKHVVPHLTYDPRPAMFNASKESAAVFAERDLTWVSNFQDHGGIAYNPHITLGVGRLEAPESFTFTATRLAICHLGGFCTCRNILYEV